MIFGPVPLAEAEGLILGHNIAGPDGKRALRKGRPLSADDIQTLARLGRSTVYAARLEPGDLDENQAARRVAQAIAGPGLRMVGPSAGRANLLATAGGVFRVNVDTLARINDIEGITIATLAKNDAVGERQTVATIKIIPYALPKPTVEAVEQIAAGAAPVIRVDALEKRRVRILFSGSPSIRNRLLKEFTPLTRRLEALQAEVSAVDFIPLEDEQGEAALAAWLSQAAGSDLVLLAGETAIMDRQDIVPRALERAGGRIECVGVPVDPGNLLMLGYLGETPVLGVPGCARSKKTNIIDWVLPRLLVGDRLVRSDMVALGHRGLLEDTRQRPMPRSRVE